MKILTVMLTSFAVFAFCSTQQKAKETNLLPNGTFDANQKILTGWDSLPDDGTVKWVSIDKKHGKGIVFKLSKAVAESTGLLFYSAPISIKEGKKYKFSLEYKSSGPVPKPFVKGYGMFPNADGKIEPRELYKKQIFEKDASNEWKILTMEFTPQNPIYKGKYEIKWIKVLLYAYLKSGEIYFDNIRIEEAE